MALLMMFYKYAIVLKLYSVLSTSMYSVIALYKLNISIINIMFGDTRLMCLWQVSEQNRSCPFITL